MDDFACLVGAASVGARMTFLGTRERWKHTIRVNLRRSFRIAPTPILTFREATARLPRGKKPPGRLGAGRLCLQAILQTAILLAVVSRRVLALQAGRRLVFGNDAAGVFRQLFRLRQQLQRLDDFRIGFSMDL